MQMKENNLVLMYHCTGDKELCVYCTPAANVLCVYYDFGECMSAVARVNRLVIEKRKYLDVEQPTRES